MDEERLEGDKLVTKKEYYAESLDAETRPITPCGVATARLSKRV